MSKMADSGIEEQQAQEMGGPRAALRYCPRGHGLVRRRCPVCELARGRARPAWETRWYGHPVWRARSQAQLAQHPRCARCGAGATVAGHVVPHRGDWTAFITGALVSLCFGCNRRQAAEDS